MKKYVILIFSALLSTHLYAVDVLKTASSVAAKAWAFEEIEDYKGLTYLHGLSELALASGDKDLLKRAKDVLDGFAEGKYTGRGSFISYRCGGKHQYN